MTSTRRWDDIPEGERVTPERVLRGSSAWPADYADSVRRWGPDDHQRRTLARLAGAPGCPAAVRSQYYGRDEYLDRKYQPCVSPATVNGYCSHHASTLGIPMQPDPDRRDPVRDARARNALRRSQVFYAEDVERLGDDELLKIRTLGVVALSAIRSALATGHAEYVGLRYRDGMPGSSIAPDDYEEMLDVFLERISG